MKKDHQDQAQKKLQTLSKRIAKAPTSPGVYRWLDHKGTILYVGKAKNLRNRLGSYVSEGSKNALGPWKRSLMEHAEDFSVTVTTTELEALVLETNLIKENKPKYNVLMKDDKNYVYVRIGNAEAYPGITVVRRMTEDGAEYFGPFTNASEVHSTLTMLRKIFPFRACRMEIIPKPQRKDSIINCFAKKEDRSTLWRSNRRYNQPPRPPHPVPRLPHPPVQCPVHRTDQPGTISREDHRRHTEIPEGGRRRRGDACAATHGGSGQSAKI
ncbi:MAG: GIY-YIG nuclease family protein [Candidatus Peregrinibacteria bacterium]